jgi:hypothetical protein
MVRVGVGALAGFLTLLGLGAGAAPAGATVAVGQGAHYGSRIFPDDAFTVADSSQVTGRRVNLRLGVDYPTVDGVVQPDCTPADYSFCDGFSELDKLDGFDIQPRVTVPFTGAINVSSVDDSDFFIANDAGVFVSGLRQLTFDPVAHVLAGISDKQLSEDTTYRIVVKNAIKDAAGAPVNACGGACVVGFTTRAASGELVRIRKSMDLALSDPANAYRLAGFPGASTSTASRRLTFTQNGVDDVFLASSVAPSLADPLNGMVRTDQVKADPSAPGALAPSAVPNLIPPGAAGYFAFGSFLSPRYQYASASAREDQPYGVGSGLTDGEIPPVPTSQTPKPFGADRIGAIVVTPNPAQFPPPWPAAVYGPGFTRSDYDIFVSADYNASRGILTVATDPAGHGFGSHSTTTVTANGAPTTFLSYGRGRDLDGDGKISDGLNDGVGPTGHVPAGGSVSNELPSHKPLDGLRSGLEQTVVDNMALGRALAAGLNIPGVGNNLVDPKQIMYYGISFGGIYGTMLMGTDPLFHRGLMNVPGGPIADIARLSSFRGDLADNLKRSRPDMLNGGPGLNGFTEDLPLRNEPPEVIAHPGASALQELLAASDWLSRSGSPETFAPRIRLRPDPAWASTPKQVAFQTAYGDGTVPNPTAGTLYRAGQLFDRVVYYRNDKTPTYGSDPHGWLADPTLAGRSSGQQQLAEFLSSGQLVNTNPAWLEVPIADSDNLTCLHYPDPQTGQQPARQPYPGSGDCPPPLAHGTPGSAVGLGLTDVAPAAATRGTSGTPGGAACVDRRGFRFAVHHGRGARVVDVRVFVNGKLRLHRRGRALQSVTLRRLPLGTFTVKVVSRWSTGARRVSVRVYRGCGKGPVRTRGARGRRRRR